MANVIHLLALLLTPLVQSGYAASARWIKDVPYYTASLIDYHAQQKFGRFEAVFYDLSAGTGHGQFTELLLQPQLAYVTKYVMDETFQATFDNFPVKPSITVVYTADRNLQPPRCPVLVRHFFATLDSNAKVIVLVNFENFNAYQSIMFMLTNLRFDKVIYIATTINMFVQMGYNGIADNILEGIPHPKDLIRSNIRKSHGRPIGFTYRFPPWYHIQGWVIETGRYLNLSLTLYPNICTESMSGAECMDRLFNAYYVDISLDQTSPNIIVWENYRSIIGRQLGYRVILAPQGRQFNAMEVFTKPFSWKLWIVLLLLLISVEIVSVLCPQIFQNDPVLLALCGIQKYDLHLASLKEKVALLPMVIFCFLMCNAYETKIISFMVNKPTIGNINSLAELAKSGLKITANLHGDERLINDTLLGSQIIQTPNGTDESLLDDQYAHLTNNLDAHLLLALRKNYDFKLSRPKFSLINERKSTSIFTFWIGNVSPYAETLHYTQKVFFEAGLLDKWKQDEDLLLVSKDRSIYRRMDMDASGMLTFDDLVPNWIVYVVGLVVSLVVFVLEGILHRFSVSSKITFL